MYVCMYVNFLAHNGSVSSAVYFWGGAYVSIKTPLGLRDVYNLNS